MQITFKDVYLVISMATAIWTSLEIQCMRRVVPSIVSRAYTLPKISQTAAEKINAIDKEIAEQRLLKQQIYRGRTQAILNDIKTVSFYTALYGSWHVPVYGLKSLLVSGGITAVLVPFIVACHPFTPFDKRQIQQRTAAIQELEKKKIRLFKDHR